MSKKTVVIIGGGFAGSKIAKQLEEDFEITLIDDKDYFEYTPGILRVVVKPSHIKKIQVLHNNYLKNTEILNEEVTKIGKEYVTINNQKILFDYLVIATGSRGNKIIDHPKSIIPSKAKLLENNYNKLLKAKKILIIGGGLVGVELAAEISTYHKDKEITLINANERIMPQENNKSAKYAENFLKNKGVRLILNEKIIKTNDPLITDKGTRLNSDLIFLCTGIKPNSEFMEKNFKDKLTEKKFIKVNKCLQLEGIKNIFVAGDVANINEIKLAQNAEKHAKIIIKNIDSLEKNKPLSIYESKPRTMVISLGKYRGIINYKNRTITGIIPGNLKNILEYSIMKNTAKNSSRCY